MKNVTFEEAVLNEEYNTVSLYFQAPKSIIKQAFPGKYKDVDATVICLEFAGQDPDEWDMCVSCMISPMYNGSDYDWTMRNIAPDDVEEFIGLFEEAGGEYCYA